MSSDSSSVLTDSIPELTTGIMSGKGKVDGDLETENSILYFRDGMIHFFTNYNLDYFIRRCKPIIFPIFIPRIEVYQKKAGIVHRCVRDIMVTYDIFCDININCTHVLL